MARIKLPKMSRLDRAIALVSPSIAHKRYKSRCALAMAEAYTGSSKNRRSMANWSTPSGDFNTDVLPELDELRERSEHLFRNNMIAAGAINTKATSVVGPGLTMQSRIDRDYLRLSEAQADAWESAAEREWRLFSESKLCSTSKKHNFRELQNLSILSSYIRGDIFILTPEESETTYYPYKLRFQAIEADRVSNPQNEADSDTLAGGVEIDKNGGLVAIHVQKGHPGNPLENQYEWEKRYFYGAKTGRRNILHLYRPLRVGQSRGVPDLAPVIEGLKQFGELTQATIDAAVVQTFLSVFIKTTDGSGLGLEEGTLDATNNVKLGSGAIIDLAEGEEPVVVDPTHPNGNYGTFATEFYRQIGIALQIPHELLIKHFTASYSAAQAALLEAWRYFTAERQRLIDNLCQPAYELFLAEAVSSGRLHAPGFFSDPAIRAAYCGADWVGQPRGHIDESKQNKADGYAEDRGWKTASQNTQERGGIWERNHKQRVKEVTRRRADGLESELETLDGMVSDTGKGE